MTRSSYCALALGLVFCAGPALAAAPFQFAAPKLQAPKNPDVNGMRLSFLYGENRSQRGFDLGLLSVSETSTFSGLALVCGVSRVTGDMSGGAAFSLINWHSGRDSGLNGAFINFLGNPDGAFNVGFVTLADGESMIDFGGFNMSKKSTAQIGFINVTDEIKSFQFGFLNLAKNGFLPIFPVFNFPKP